MDWKTIKTEYITDESSSYRKLAEKYGVSLTAIVGRSKKENWVEEKQRFKNKTETKSLEKISEQQSDRVAKFMQLTDTLTEKLIQAFEVIDPSDTQGLRQLTASLKDLKEMQGVKSETDLREQEARIRNLERQAQSEEVSNEIKVVIEGDINKYSK